MHDSDKKFAELWLKLGSPVLVAQELGISERYAYTRRGQVEKRLGISLPTTNAQGGGVRRNHTSGLVSLDAPDSVGIVFSDAHFQRGVRTTAFRGLLALIKQLKPDYVINGGDAFDGASVSRHPRNGWTPTPSVIDELLAVDDALGEIETAVKPGCGLYWTEGNHDQRYNSFLSSRVPEFQNVDGFDLQSRYPKWNYCMMVELNKDTVIKHRWHNGIHATYNNTLKSGKNIVTGHLHQLKVAPWNDYRGRRYGVDAGTLAEPYDTPFAYTELNPVNWHSGFIVLTSKHGVLLSPELVQKWDEDTIEFRGHLLNADTGEVL